MTWKSKKSSSNQENGSTQSAGNTGFGDDTQHIERASRSKSHSQNSNAQNDSSTPTHYTADAVTYQSETCSSSRHSTLTTPEIEETKTGKNENVIAPGLLGNSRTPFWMCQTKVMSESPSHMKSAHKVISEKPPPAPNPHKPAIRKSNCNTSDTSTPKHSSLAKRRPRPKSSPKSVSFASRHEEIPPRASISSTEMNVQFLKCQLDRLSVYSDDSSTDMKSETQGQSENVTKYHATLELKHEELDGKSSGDGSVPEKRFTNSDSEHESSTDLDLNLNKQAERLSKASALDDINTEKREGAAITNSFRPKEEIIENEPINVPNENSTETHQHSLFESNEIKSKQDPKFSEVVPLTQEKSEDVKDTITKTTGDTTKLQEHSDAGLDYSKDSPEQKLISDKGKYVAPVPPSFNGPEVSEAGVTSDRSDSSITNPAKTEEVRQTPDYQGSIYDYYYKDEMTFPSLSTQHHHLHPKGRLIKHRHRAELWRPHRATIYFQPQPEADGPYYTPEATAPMGWGAQLPLGAKLPPKWEHLEYDDRCFPVQHNLQTSSDLNREMKRVMRFHDCRKLPKIPETESDDQYKSRLFFNTHGWFPCSTTGAKWVKFRENFAQVKRQWYNQWHGEVTLRNAVHEPRKQRHYERGRPDHRASGSRRSNPYLTHVTELLQQPSASPGYKKSKAVDAFNHDESGAVALGSQYIFDHSKNGSGQSHNSYGPGGSCPNRPMTTPRATPNGMETASRNSEEMKTTKKCPVGLPISNESSDCGCGACRRTAHWVHSKGSSCYPGDKANAQKSSSETSLSPPKRTQRKQRHSPPAQQQYRRNFKAVGDEINFGQAGDSTKQTCSPETGNLGLLTDQGYATLGPIPRGPGELSKVAGNGRGESLLATLLRERPDSDETVSGAPFSTAPVQEISRRPSAKRGNSRHTQGKERETPGGVSWEIKHLNNMLTRTLVESGKRSK